MFHTMPHKQVTRPVVKPVFKPAPVPAFNLCTFVTAFEAGELDQDAVIEGFQAMIDSGIVWRLQGSYGRTAVDLINAGLCALPQR